MGVYLSEPNKEKKINEGFKKGVSYCVAEMQGKFYFIQAGEETCKMQPFARLTLVMETRSLQSLMDMEVPFFAYEGPEVSKYVEKIFIEELKALNDYKNKNYQKALDEAFRKVD